MICYKQVKDNDPDEVDLLSAFDDELKKLESESKKESLADHEKLSEFKQTIQDMNSSGTYNYLLIIENKSISVHVHLVA